MQALPWIKQMYTGYEPGIGHGFGVGFRPRMEYGFEKGRLLQIDPLWLRNLAALGQMDWMSDARQWGYPGGAPVPFSMVPRNIPVPPAPPPVPPPPPAVPPAPEEPERILLTRPLTTNLEAVVTSSGQTGIVESYLAPIAKERALSNPDYQEAVRNVSSGEFVAERGEVCCDS